MKELEAMLHKDKNIMKEEALIYLLDICIKKHGKSIPGYTLCQTCVDSLLDLLTACHLHSADVKARMHEIYGASLVQDSDFWPSCSSSDLGHAFRMALNDAAKHEDHDITVSSQWIALRTRHYLRANKH